METQTGAKLLQSRDFCPPHLEEGQVGQHQEVPPLLPVRVLPSPKGSGLWWGGGAGRAPPSLQIRRVGARLFRWSTASEEPLSSLTLTRAAKRGAMEHFRSSTHFCPVLGRLL